MKYKVGLNKKKISSISIGCLHFGNFVDFKEAEKIVKHAVDHGINYIDTAPMYGLGSSEKFLGKITKSFRKNILIGTKVGLQTIKSDNTSYAEISGLQKKNITKSVDNSLKNLKTDYIDYFQLHCFDNNTPLEETFEVLINLKKLGKIRSIGVCNYEYENLKSLERQDFLQHTQGLHTHYNLIERRLEEKIVEFLKKFKISLFCYQALARGFLTGKYEIDKEISKSTRAYGSKRFDRYFQKNIFLFLKKVKFFLKKHEFSLLDLSLKWLLDKDYVTSLILGFRNVDQLNNVLIASNKIISEDVYKTIDKMFEEDVFMKNYIKETPYPFLEK